MKQAERQLAICKGVSAFANSTGGQFVTGVTSKDQKPHSLDGGFKSSKRDWIYQNVNTKTSPPIENFDVIEIEEDGGFYYVIDVPVSYRAPHQYDTRYYKRRGSHSDPMEHYEIEDVRNRPKAEVAPFRANVVADNFVALLEFVKSDLANPIINLQASVSANFDIARGGLSDLGARTFSRLAAGNSISFYLDSFAEILRANAQATIVVDAKYEFKGARLKNTVSLSIADFDGTAIRKSPSIRAMEELAAKVDRLTDALKPIKAIADTVEQAVDGSGVRISSRTLSSLRGQSPKFNPREFDWRGYQIILDISQSDALMLERIFHMFGSGLSLRAQYEQLPENLRTRFEGSFSLDILNGED